MKLDNENLRKTVTDLVLGYLLAVLLVSVYASLRGPDGMLRLPSLASVSSTFAGTLFNSLGEGLIVFAGSQALSSYTKRLNWILSGISVGVIFYTINVVSWMAQGASGPEIAIYSTIFGTGLIFPLVLGVSGQLAQKYGVAKRILKP